jgi:hypothetical protein
MGQHEVLEWLKHKREIGINTYYSVKQIQMGLKQDASHNGSSQYPNVALAILKIRSMKNCPLEFRQSGGGLLYRYFSND